jgi:hypothetical protein
VSTISPSTPAIPKGLPGCLKKRRLLNEPEPNRELFREMAEKFLEADWWEDALEFFKKAGDGQGLEKIKNHCLETGDAAMLARLGLRQDPKTWRQVAERALELGKLRYARRAFELAGDPDKAAMVEGLIAGAETSD